MALQSRIFSAGDLAYQSWSKSYAIDLIITEESTSIENNTSLISYRLQLRSGANNRFSDWPIDYAVTINGSVVASGSPRVNQPYNSTTVLASGFFSVPHEDDGSKNLSVKAYINSEDVRPYLPPRIEIDELMGMTYIPRASRISCTDAYIGSTGNITIYSNSSSFVHTVFCKFGEAMWYVTADGGSSSELVYLSVTNIPFYFSDVMYTQIPNARSGSGLIRCETYLTSDRNTPIGTTYANFTAMTLLDRCYPTISGTVEDANAQTIALTGDKNRLVRYHSTALCKATVEIKNSATTKITKVNDIVLSSGSVSIPNVEENVFNFFVQDSRDYQGFDTVTLDMVPYVKLTNNAYARRTEPTSGNVTLRFSGDYYNGSFGNVQNTITLKYKLSTEQEYKTADAVIEDNKYTATVQLSGLDYQRVFQIETVVSDQLSTISKSLTVNKGIPVFSWGDGYFRVHGALYGQHMEARGNCQNADEATVTGVYKVVPTSINVPFADGILISFNTSQGNGYGAVWQVAISADGATRQSRVNWFDRISPWQDL